VAHSKFDPFIKILLADAKMRAYHFPNAQIFGLLLIEYDPLASQTGFFSHALSLLASADRGRSQAVFLPPSRQSVCRNYGMGSPSEPLGCVYTEICAPLAQAKACARRNWEYDTLSRAGEILFANQPGQKKRGNSVSRHRLAPSLNLRPLSLAEPRGTPCVFLLYLVINYNLTPN